MANIYVASSWRNALQPDVVKALKAKGHEVYDFRNPTTEYKGFHWYEIDPKWESWSPAEFRRNLGHPIAREGFLCDYAAMQKADTCVLVLPSGRSSHLEAGYFTGANKRLLILLSSGEPELMYSMADTICTSLNEIIFKLKGR